MPSDRTAAAPRSSERLGTAVLAASTTALLALTCARFEPLAADGLEIGRLGWLAAASIFGLGLAGVSPRLLGAAATLVPLALLTLPAGTRSFVAAALPALLLALRSREVAREEAPAPEGHLGSFRHWFPTFAGLLLAAQPLLRTQALLEAWVDLPDRSASGMALLAARAVGLPLLAATGTALVAAHRGGALAIAAALAACLLGPGATMHSSLALLAAGAAAWAGEAWKRPHDRAPGVGRGDRPLAMLVALSVVGLAFLAWEPRATLAAALVLGIQVAGPRAGLLGALGALAVASLFPAAPAPGIGPADTLRNLPEAGAAALSWLTVLLPGAMLALGARVASGLRETPTAGWRWDPALRAVAWASLTAAILVGVPARSLLPALALPAVGLLLLAFPASGRARAIHNFLPPQTAALALLSVPVALTAAFPWLRPDPLAALLARLGPAQDRGLEPCPWPAPSGWLALGALALLAGLVGLAASRRATSTGPGPRIPPQWGNAFLAAAAVFLVVRGGGVETGGVGRPSLPLLPAGQAVELTAGQPVWSSAPTDTAAGPAARLEIETMLSNAALLPAGTVVARLRVREAGSDGALGRPLLERTIAAGRETGEWAARRRDLRSLPGAQAPPPFRHAFPAVPGFLGQSYRLTQELPAASSLIVEIERDPALADSGLVLNLLRIEVFGARATGRAPEDNPFAGTLWVLPVVGLLFATVRRRLQALAARPPEPAPWQPWCLAGLVSLALLFPNLALPGLAPPIAAGFVLLLAVSVLRYLPALRRALGPALPRRPDLVFFLLPLAVYLAILPWSTAQRPPDGDEPYYLLVAHSLAYDFDTDLRNNYAAEDGRAFVNRRLEPQLGDPVGADGALYSRHNELLPLTLALPYRLFGLRGALAVMAAFAAALAWLTLRLARHYVPSAPASGARPAAGTALLAWALFAFASPLVLFSTQVWAEVPAALLCLVALDHMLDLRHDRDWSTRRWIGIAAPILLLPLLKLRFVLLAGPLLVLTAWHARRPRRPLVAMGALLAAVIGAVVVHNVVVFGNPLKIHSWEEVNPQGFTVWNYLHGLLGFFFDGAFGLFPYFPIWLLLVPALWIALRRRAPVLFDLAVVFLPYLVIVGRRREWFGGWSPPFRYALVALPLLALVLLPLLVSAVRRRAGTRFLVAGLLTVTLALGLLWIVVPGWTYNIADGRTYLIDHLERRWQSDVGRLLPSSVRPRAAFWWSMLAAAAGTAVVFLGARVSRRPGGSRRLFSPAGAGVLAAALGFAALPFLARRLPTRTIEMEDPWVTKHGGHLHPDLWTVDRPLYRGGWTLRGGEWSSAPIVPGGREVHLRANLRYVRNTPAPIALEIRAGDRLLARWIPKTPGVWDSVDLGRHPWPGDGAPLVIAAAGEASETPLAGLIVDRVDLDWSAPRPGAGQR